MNKRMALNVILIAVGALAPFLVVFGYLLSFSGAPLGCLLFYGAGPAGCITLLAVLIVNRKELKLFGWLILLIYLAIDICMITPFNRHLILKFQNRTESIVFSYKGNNSGAVHQMSSEDWDSIQSLRKPTMLYFISADVSDAGITRLEGNPYIYGIFFDNCPNITDEVIQPLSKVPRLKRIYFFGIPQLKEPDFSDLAKLKKLFCIELGHCKNLSVKRLESIPPLPRLKYISMFACPPVSQEVIELLNDKNPQCKFSQ